MEKREKFYYRLLNSIFVRNTLMAIIIDFIFELMNIVKSIFGIKSDFVGQTRIACRVRYFLLKGAECVILKPNGIYDNEKLLEAHNLHILDLMPMEGIYIYDKDLDVIKKKINESAKGREPSISIKYYRIRGLFKLVTLGFLVSYFIFFYILFSPLFKFTPISHKLFTSLWIIPNTYFFIQTILFYISRLKHLTMKANFREADREEIRAISMSEDQPYVISVVPTYLEEPEMLKRTLYSLCLQNYRNMHTVLLMGNDVYSSSKKDRENTRQMKAMAIKIKKDIRFNKNRIRKQLEKINPEKINTDIINTDRINTDKINNRTSLVEGFILTGNLYEEISGWFLEKAHEIEDSKIKYPTDSYLVKNTFNKRYEYIKKQSCNCRKTADDITVSGELSDDNLIEYKKQLVEYITELKSLFSITLEAFTRTKYENLEQEKTKAGNLTAYTSLIGGRWAGKKQPDGKFILVPSDKGKEIQEPRYLAVFDSDTVTKPDYIIRKVAFLERKNNSKVGLIQSPYVIPTPEETNVASASGILSYWFLPVSVALTAFKSAYWLGFNGVLRFKAVKKIGNFLTDTIIEDTQNSIKLKKAGYEIITSPEENCITFSPFNLKAMKIQRIRWASGGFEIAGSLIRGFIKKEPGYNTFLEKILGLNYVLGLNMLSLAVTSVFIIEGPFFGWFYFAETLPFILYIVSYVTLLKSLTKYKLMHIVDGLAIALFANLYHLAGTVYSIKGLFKKEQAKFFNSTPRKKAVLGYRLGDLEFFGILALIVWLGMKFINQILFYDYYDFFQIFHITLAIYGIYRFHGKKSSDSGIMEVKEERLQETPKIKPIGVKNKYTLRIFALAAAVILIFFIPSGIKVFQIKEMNKIEKEAELILYNDKPNEIQLDAFEQNRKLGRGINFGNALEAPNEGEWGVKIKEEYFKIIKDAGFDTVRIPINWSEHAQKKSPYKIDESFFVRIDWVLLNAKKNSLNVVIDFHGYTECYVNIDKNYKRILGIWKQIAGRYKNCDSSVYYEVFNEPNRDMTVDKWNMLLKDIIREIRAVDSYHTLIVSGADWGNVHSLDRLNIPLEEKNVICTFHTYNPAPFTHQGADFASDELMLLKNIVWPGPPSEPLKVNKKILKVDWVRIWVDDYNNLPYEENPAGPKPIIEELDIASKWGKDNNRPMWLGEFGAVTTADIKSRINWTSFIVRECEKRGITWAYWDFAGKCKVYDAKEKKWESELLNSLIHN